MGDRFHNLIEGLDVIVLDPCTGGVDVIHPVGFGLSSYLDVHHKRTAHTSVHLARQWDGGELRSWLCVHVVVGRECIAFIYRISQLTLTLNFGEYFLEVNMAVVQVQGVPAENKSVAEKCNQVTI